MKAATDVNVLAAAFNMISIHAAREGGDQAMGWAVLHLILFQSTPPVKAATIIMSTLNDGWNISIHAAREGGDIAIGSEKYIRIISIHAAREGGDHRLKLHPRKLCKFQSTPPVKAATIKDGGTSVSVSFQSTPPVKAATVSWLRKRQTRSISIHAAREGGDGLSVF